MLRISVTLHPHGTTVTLEGRVVGAWIDELRSCWRRQRAADAGPIRVNLDGVTFVDDAGRAVLGEMHVDGAVLVATSVMMRALVDEVGRHHRPGGVPLTRSSQP